MQLNKQLVDFLIPGITVLLVGIVAYGFGVSNRLAGFSDDSATYLIMANYFSPFTETPESLIRAYQNVFLPPGFPIVLAFFGGAESIYISHVIVISEVLLAIAICYFLFKKTLGPGIAIYPLLIFITLPGMWIELLKIMSENQYMLLTFGFLCFVEFRKNNPLSKAANSFITGLFLSFILLTRDIGYSMLIAYLIWLMHSEKTAVIKKDFIYLVVGLVIPLVLWTGVKPDSMHSYADDFLLFQQSSSPIVTLFTTITDNIYALHQAWLTNLVLFTLDNDITREIIIFISLLLVLAGWVGRIKKLDGLYVLIYVAVLLLWPYTSEMNRFIYPIMPLLLMYFLLGIKTIRVINNSRYLIPVISIVFILLITTPALFFIAKRHQLGSDIYHEDVTNIIELYKNPSVYDAFRTALIWNHTHASMKTLATYFGKNDRILAVKPTFFTYLTGIYAEKLPRDSGYKFDEWISTVKSTGATHLFVSTVTIPANPNGTKIISKLSYYAEEVMIETYNLNDQEIPIMAIYRLN
jgi:hypothetical protein